VLPWKVLHSPKSLSGVFYRTAQFDCLI